MDSGATDLFQTGVWLIPIILVASVAGLYLLVRYWHRKTQQNLKQLRGELRRLQSRRKAVHGAATAYSPEDPEPYGSRAAGLHEHLEAIESQAFELEQRHVSLRERMARLAPIQWQALIGSPFLWFLLRQEVINLWRGCKAQETALDEVEANLQAISRLPWEIAQQARAAREAYQLVSRRMDGLRSRGLHGEAMEAAARQEGDCRHALASVPRFFLVEEEEAVLQTADKNIAAEAFAAVSAARPVLEELLARSQSWESGYAEAEKKAGRMRQMLDSLANSLEAMPAELDRTALRQRLDQLQQIARNLGSALGRAEVESLHSLAGESTRVADAAQELEKQLRRTRQGLSGLERGLAELSEGLNGLSGRFSALAHASIHPIAWEGSKNQLTAFSQQLNAIGPAKKARTPEAVEGDVAVLGQLNQHLKDLSRRIGEVEGQHAELIALLERPEFVQGREWYLSTKKLQERMFEYAPENWARVEGADTLEEDLQAMAAGMRALVTGDPAEPIVETQLPKRLEEIRQFARFYEALRTRADGLKARLAELQRSEEAARQALEGGQMALGQISLLARSNAFLEEIASAEINRLNSGYASLRDDLAVRSGGPVEAKARSASAWTARIEAAAGAWLEALNKELGEQSRVLSEQLTGLQAVAALDEPAVSDARRLLSAGQPLLASAGARSRLRLEELILELKRRCDHWQSCEAAIRALEDVGGPLLETYDIARQHREYARERVGELAAWLRGAGAWPPTTVNLDAERHELASIDEQWESMKKGRAKALALVAHLGNLAAKYQAVAEKARQTAERAAGEQNQVESLESQLSELTQLWQEQWHNHRDNPLLAAEIRRLLGEIDVELTALKKGYRQGQKNYAEILEALRLLHRKARMAQVPLDDSHLIDVNGRLIAYR